MANRIQHRRDTAARWAEYNPILLEGEVGYLTDNPNLYKIGDGVNAWNDLPMRGVTQETGVSEELAMSQKAATESLAAKVDKVAGKQLSTEDFTTLLKEKLDGLSNYDDSAITAALTKLRNEFDTLVNGDASSAIESFNEIVAFLSGLEDSQNIDSIIAAIETQIASKVDKMEGKGLSTNDYTTEDKEKLEGVSVGATKTTYEGNVSEGTTIGTLTIDGVEHEVKSPLAATEIENFYSYGVEFDTSVSSPTCTRIGNPELHRTLPVHSLMRGCLLADDGTVNQYLDASSWENETRDGSLGQVMVELPQHYRKFEEEGTKRRVRISLYPLFGYHLVPKQYVSAYQATVQRSVTTLCSVVNADADYRGGNNNSGYDGTYRSMLGRAATSISRTNYRAYARKRKADSTEWNCMTYDIQKILYWFFVVEYATLNSQAEYNAEKDSNGYAQGGLGAGVTTWSDSLWSAFNSYNPFVPCGHTDAIGNGTGVVDYTVVDADGADLKTFSVPRYRGVENPFGHIWQWTDGINVCISPTVDNGGDGLSKVYVCSDPSKFNDSNYDGYTYVGDEARTNGYGVKHIFGEYGEMIPQTVGGGSTTYMCDYHYTNIPESAEALRGVRFGGYAYHGANAGFACAAASSVPSYTDASIGSRLCFIPAN